MWGCGNNWNENIGNPSYAGTTIVLDAVQASGVSDVVDISQAQLAVYALDSSGNIWAWSNDQEGRTGLTNAINITCTTYYATPKKVQGVGGGSTFLKATALGQKMGPVSAFAIIDKLCQ